MARLGDVVLLDARQVQPDAIDYGQPYIGLESIGGSGAIDETVRVEPGAIRSAKVRYDGRHILYGKLRPNLGKVARPTVAGVASTDIYPLLPSGEIDRSYLAWFLLRPETIAWAASRTAGVNLPRISWRVLSEMDVPLPPLAEQRRIAAILDQADALRREYGAAMSKTEELLARTFANAVSTSGAPRTPLGDFIESTQNGLYKPATDYGRGVRMLRIADFSPTNRGVRSAALRVDVTEVERSRFALDAGDVVVNRVNALSHIGKTALVLPLDEPMVFESNMMRLRVKSELLRPAFAARLLQSEDAAHQLRRAAKQAINQASINQSDLRELRVCVPDVSFQDALVARLGAIDAQIDRLNTALDKCSRLFASLQHRAFRGEL